MKLFKDALIALGIMSLWVVLAWWHVNNSSVQAQEMPAYRIKPPACVLRTNNYFDYDFSYEPPRLAGWYQRRYLSCPVAGGEVVID